MAWTYVMLAAFAVGLFTFFRRFMPALLANTVMAIALILMLARASTLMAWTGIA